MATRDRNVENRSWLKDRLRAEVVGPDPSGEPVDISVDGTTFLTWKEFNRPKMQSDGQEILWKDSPIKRYGAGILFPKGVTESIQLAEEADSTPEAGIEEEPGPDIRGDEEIEDHIEDDPRRTRILADETEDYEVSLANSYRPSALGMSFLADLGEASDKIIVEVNCARYTRVKIRVGMSPEDERFSERELWYRKPCLGPDGKALHVEFAFSEFNGTASVFRKWLPGYEDQLEIIAVIRKFDAETSTDKQLVTISMINRNRKDEGRIDQLCFFQSSFTVRNESGQPWIFPYPEPQKEQIDPADEEQINSLLYRQQLTFAVGHGCSIVWEHISHESISGLTTDTLPTFEVPSMSADIFDKDGNPLRVSMRKLAGLEPTNDGTSEIQKLIEEYHKWIQGLEKMDERLPSVPAHFRDTAELLVKRCRECLERIKAGYEFLQMDTPDSAIANEAFQLANHAMLIAQLRSSREVRKPVWSDSRLTWDYEISNPDPSVPHPDKGYWRAFQIAFLLMNLPGIVNPEHEDREIVDLIWFPTGGGKTEAYLGLAAFTIFFNRLSGKESYGVDVIMRYTLRLLTAQQFQRAGILFCAMEHLRKNPENLARLGEKRFKLGMWVGGDATPNTRVEAIRTLKSLERNPDSENKFVLLKCPWCNAKFGPREEVSTSSGGRRRSRRSSASEKSVYGYTTIALAGRRTETVAYQCDDPECEFGINYASGSNTILPITVIDEDIYSDPPNLIIGTVDKFALVAWKPEVRSFFGIDENGRHPGLPPTLIIQDELHLISGPLGSMVGAYETVIEELCSKYDDGITIRPKIVASTATISRAEDQVRALYARERVALFPPSGLEANDSFYAIEARSEDGHLEPGRIYLGIMAPGHGSPQTTQARVYASLLQNSAIMPVMDNDESERDPWWTLLAFFNSLRELGGAATLLVADARDYLRVILDRHGIQYNQIRQLLNWDELTSRVRSDKIPQAIQKLETPFKRDDDGYIREPVDVCLASNIIEVGVDIDRLSLMTIVGQPKTTSQYIQVSSRVGRNPDAPGLVVVIYNPSKPRDRSHYERFRTYHQSLYAQVEPTSVTPFSPPAVERALHAIIVAITRQLTPPPVSDNPRPYPLEEGTDLRERIIRLVLERVRIVDSDEIENVRASIMKRLREWQAWDPSEYGGFGAPPVSPPLIYPAGSRELPDWLGHSWPTMNSMRNVDATCEGEVTVYYNEVDEKVQP